jgi:hypothetical protein
MKQLPDISKPQEKWIADVFRKRSFLHGYKALMSGNQSFNQCLYAPLTQAPLVC